MPALPIKYKDTLKEMPKGYKAAITNPPYLNKSVAVKNKMDFPETEYNDVYKYALAEMLKNIDYVAAIIPESFIRAILFHDRLDSITFINFEMFSDTEIPVCLALFVPEKTEDFKLYKGENFIGTYQEIYNKKIKSKTKIDWVFNDKAGNIGIVCLDSKNEKSICFCMGTDIKKEIKESSRSYTKVSGIPDNIDLENFINKCNEILNNYRETTFDLFLTTFRGLRKDGESRKRLPFSEAKKIMNYAVELLIC